MVKKNNLQAMDSCSSGGTAGLVAAGWQEEGHIPYQTPGLEVRRQKMDASKPSFAGSSII